MANKLYVGNLPFSFTPADLEKLFAPIGVVRATEVIMDRETGRSRGFGFVEMETSAAMLEAIATLHEKEVDGRSLTVNEARERAPRAAGGGGGGRSFGGGGTGGGAPRGVGGGGRGGGFAGGGGRDGARGRPPGGRDGGRGGDRGGERDGGGRGKRRGEYEDD